MSKWKRIEELAAAHRAATTAIAKAEANRRRKPNVRTNAAVTRARKEREAIRSELDQLVAAVAERSRVAS